MLLLFNKNYVDYHRLSEEPSLSIKKNESTYLCNMTTDFFFNSHVSISYITVTPLIPTGYNKQGTVY